MKFSPSFEVFVTTGRHPTSDREKSSLLDEARAVIGDIIRRVDTGEIALCSSPTNSAGPSKAQAQAATRELEKAAALHAARRAAASKPAPAPAANYVNPPKAPAKPAAPAAPTAEATATGNGVFKRSIVPTLTREEFDLLTPADKARFFREGGKLVPSPSPAKPTHKNGKLTRAGFDLLTPTAKAAHCKSGAGIIA